MHPNPVYPTDIPMEEADELKLVISKLEKENGELHLMLSRVTHERNELKFNLKYREKLLKESEEMAEDERINWKRVGEFLEGVGLNLNQRNKDLRETQQINGECKDLWENTLTIQKTMGEGFETRIRELTQLLKESQCIL